MDQAERLKNKLNNKRSFENWRSSALCLQYARETDQLNKMNRNEGRQKLFSLDPETQV